MEVQGVLAEFRPFWMAESVQFVQFSEANEALDELSKIA